MAHGKKMKKLRGEKAQRVVAEDIGVSFSSYVKYERDERTPRDPIKKKIADYFGVTVSSIFFSPNEH